MHAIGALCAGPKPIPLVAQLAAGHARGRPQTLAHLARGQFIEPRGSRRAQSGQLLEVIDKAERESGRVWV